MEYRAYSYRWVVLAFFGLVLAVQNFLWLSFAPIESFVQKALGISATQARLLALVGPFMFILIGSYAGSLSDRRGFKFATSVGVVMMVAAGIVKAATPHLVSSDIAQYWIYLSMQVLGGAGSVFALVNLSKMPIKWFPEKQRALANGLTTMSLYLGTAVSLVLVPVFANIPKHAGKAACQQGLNRVFIFTAVIMGVSAVLYFLFTKEEPPSPAGPILEAETIGMRQSLPRFLRSTTFRALCFVSLMGYGIYIAMTVTMEKIIKFHGFTASFASLVAGGITLGGIFGASILPGVSEKVGVRKPFLILAAAVAIPTLILIAVVSNRPVDLLAGVVMGFFLLPALPVTFTIVGEMEEIGPRLAGTAVGTLLAVGSIGSVVVPLVMELFAKKKTAELIDYRLSLVILAALGFIAMLVVIKYVRETGPKAGSR